MTAPDAGTADLSRRKRRREALFRAVIIAGTLAVCGLILAVTPTGRELPARAYDAASALARKAIGLGPDRETIEAAWRRSRARGIERTDRTYRAYFANEATPAMRRILDAGGLAPDQALLRWANYDRTVVLSSRVFEADETGRAYRLKPNTRSFWMRGGVFPNGLECFFFLPDTPDVNEAVAAAGAEAVAGSEQTTNSWGLRGPEPDLDASVRVLVLGDSFMQGTFVPDDACPPARLQRALAETRGERVCVLNTGHIGYSPEQCWYTLVEYLERFRPHAVVISLCANDFGDAGEVLEGRGGDWEEARHWVQRVQQSCRSRQVPCLLVPVPFERQLAGPRHAGAYPGQVAEISQGGGLFYLDITDIFINEHLRLVHEAVKEGRRPATSPLYNGHMNDAHFSASGCDLWGRAVAERVGRLLDIEAERARPVRDSAP